jgi:hypothetical protein
VEKEIKEPKEDIKCRNTCNGTICLTQSIYKFEPTQSDKEGRRS